MSMRALFTEMSKFTNLLNEVNASGRELTQKQMERIQDLTNNEVWWTYAQGIIAGSTGVIGGAAGIAGGAINIPIGGMTAGSVKEILKAFATGSEMIGNAGSTFAKANTIADVTKRSLAERCDLARLQQEEGNRSSSYSQMIQAIQGIQSAMARLTS